MFDTLPDLLQVLSQLLRKAKQKNLLLPNVKQAGSEQGTYEGATVSPSF
jgi:DNA polymerase delta subunit 1